MSEQCDIPGGLTIEQDGFHPITVIAGNFVYIVQAGSKQTGQVTLERSAARRLAVTLIASLGEGGRA